MLFIRVIYGKGCSKLKCPHSSFDFLYIRQKATTKIEAEQSLKIVNTRCAKMKLIIKDGSCLAKFKMASQ